MVGWSRCRKAWRTVMVTGYVFATIELSSPSPSARRSFLTTPLQTIQEEEPRKSLCIFRETPRGAHACRLQRSDSGARPSRVAASDALGHPCKHITLASRTSSTRRGSGYKARPAAPARSSLPSSPQPSVATPNDRLIR
ncbi:hypothetical protein K523DRAFT_63044 [Schizophyllum commune Tattone D]|nr:hypothetical protein K523DRAFT_63044 [Schizophyllum commune Tattone D]